MLPKNILLLLLVLSCMPLCACHHPLDCATDFVPHDDCLPGTAGYESVQHRLAVKLENAPENDDPRCRSYGLEFGTVAYAQCREQFALIRAQQASDESLANQNFKNSAKLQLLDKLTIPPSPTPFYPIGSSVTNCTTVGTSTT